MNKMIMGLSAAAATATLLVVGAAVPAHAEPSRKPVKPKPAPITQAVIEGPSNVVMGDDMAFTIRFPQGTGPASTDRNWFTWNARQYGYGQSGGDIWELEATAHTPGRNTLVVDFNGQHAEKTFTVAYPAGAGDIPFIEGSRARVAREGRWSATLQNVICEPTAAGNDCVVQLNLGGDYGTLKGRPVLNNQMVLTDGSRVTVDVDASRKYATAFAGAYDEGVAVGDCSGWVFGVYHLPAGALPDSLLLKESLDDQGVVLPIVVH